MIQKAERFFICRNVLKKARGLFRGRLQRVLLIHSFDQLAGCLKTDGSRIEHQIVVVRFTPFPSRVVLIMMDAVAVDPADFRFCILPGNSIFLYAVGKSVLQIGITEHFHCPGIIFQNEISAPSDNDAGFPGCQFLNNLAFGYEQDIV